MTKQRFQFTRSTPEVGLSAVQVVSMLSGKGGVGKSVLAYNLAERMAASGTSVLLVDLDVACGNLHILANQACRYGLSQVVGDELTPAEAVTPIRDKLDLLAAAGPGWPKDMAPATGAAHLVRCLRTQGTGYDVILVDHPSGKSEASLVMAAASDINLLLVVPELTSISDACGLYKLLLATDRSLDCRLLVNRAESDGEAEYIHRKFGALTERFYGRPPGYLGRLLEDGAFRRAVAAQSPLSAVAEDSITLADLDKIAARLAPESRRYGGVRLNSSELAINNVPAEADIRE